MNARMGTCGKRTVIHAFVITALGHAVSECAQRSVVRRIALKLLHLYPPKSVRMAAQLDPNAYGII